MRGRIIRSISLILVLVLLFSTAALAAETSSLYIAATNAYITRSGDNVNIYFFVVGCGFMDVIGAKKIYLYEQNGTTWSLVKTFDSDDSQYASHMIATNTSAKSDHVTYTEGSATKNYYAEVRFYAEKDGVSDTIPQETPTSYGTTP